MILEKYVAGEGWFICGAREFLDAEPAREYARLLVTSRQTRPGSFRLVEFGPGGARRELELFVVGTDGRVVW